MQEYFVNRRQITLVIYLLMKGDIFFKESGGHRMFGIMS